MGHMVRRTSDLLNNVRYGRKTTPEVRDAIERKLAVVRNLVRDREIRMKELREKYTIDAERLAVLLVRFQNEGAVTSYERQGGDGSPLVPAGVIANLVQEQRMIDSERQQIDKLELVLRNLRDEEPYTQPDTGEIKVRPCIHDLDDEELEYLGF